MDIKVTTQRVSIIRVPLGGDATVRDMYKALASLPGDMVFADVTRVPPSSAIPGGMIYLDFRGEE